MSEIKMQAAGYKQKMDETGKDAGVPMMPGVTKGGMCYATLNANGKELPGLDKLEQDEMYEVRGLIRVAMKETREDDNDSGTTVRLEFHKVGFAKSKGLPSEEEFNEMDEKEQDEEVRKA